MIHREEDDRNHINFGLYSMNCQQRT